MGAPVERAPAPAASWSARASGVRTNRSRCLACARKARPSETLLSPASVGRRRRARAHFSPDSGGPPAGAWCYNCGPTGAAAANWRADTHAHQTDHKRPLAGHTCDTHVEPLATGDKSNRRRPAPGPFISLRPAANVRALADCTSRAASQVRTFAAIGHLGPAEGARRKGINKFILSRAAADTNLAPASGRARRPVGARAQLPIKLRAHLARRPGADLRAPVSPASLRVLGPEAGAKTRAAPAAHLGARDTLIIGPRRQVMYSFGSL